MMKKWMLALIVTLGIAVPSVALAAANANGEADSWCCPCCGCF